MPRDSFLMSWKSRGPDRRRSARFEVVGRLAGTVTFSTDVELCNLSQGGALVVAEGPLALDSRCTLRLQADSAVELDSRVRHVVRRDAAGGYQIGLEFIAADEDRFEQVIKLLGTGQD